jgi:uncharacterized protein
VTTDQDAAMTTGDTAPPPGAVERITGLDVTRGFAVMGILLMNIIAFAMPGNAYISPLSWGGSEGIDLWTWAVNYVLVDSKMRGLFSMMFGASTLLVIERAVASGQSAGRVHYGRMGVLAAFGLVHFFVIWWGDILFLYAGMGMILFAFRNLSIKELKLWTAGMAVLTMIFASQFALLLVADLPVMPPEVQAAPAAFRADMAPDSESNREEIALYTSGLGSIVGQNLREDLPKPFIGLIIYGPETLMLMLIGMIMFKSGLLRGTWSLARLDKWALWCLGIGIIANLLLLWWQFASGLDPVVLLAATFGASIPFDVIMSIGYAALFMGLAQRFGNSGLVRRVGAAGQAAFTNYLGTSILMTFIFYGWGLGLFGSVNRAACYLFVLGAWVIMLLWSKPWLERYRYGPLEWLWRSLSRGEAQPMRR